MVNQKNGKEGHLSPKVRSILDLGEKRHNQGLKREKKRMKEEKLLGTSGNEGLSKEKPGFVPLA